MKALIEKTRRLWRDEDGGQTIEAVIWLPVFVSMLVLTIDVSTIYNRQSEMLRIVQDANRAYSTGRLPDAAATETYIKEAIGSFATNSTVQTSYANGVISTRLTVPATDLMPIDSFVAFRDKNVVIATQQLAEF